MAFHIFNQTLCPYIFGLAGQVHVKLGNFRLSLANASPGHMACHRRQIPTKFNTPGRSDKHHHQSTKWLRGLGGSTLYESGFGWQVSIKLMTSGYVIST